MYLDENILNEIEHRVEQWAPSGKALGIERVDDATFPIEKAEHCFKHFFHFMTDREK